MAKEKINKKILENIERNVSLAEKTTFRLGGPAKYFIVAKSKKDLIKAIKTAKQLKLPFFILGGGSNILFSDKGYKGMVIENRSLKFGIKNPSSKTIYAESGAKLSNLVKLSIENSLTGLEWAIGIPGTIGGAIRGNAGAFGKSIKDVVEDVEVFDAKTEKIKTYKQKDCKFKYKSTLFGERSNLVIISVSLMLKRGKKKEIEEKINEFSNYRKTTQPLSFFSAGCVFQNHKGEIKKRKLLEKFPKLKEFNRQKSIPVAYLIEMCNLKGKKIGKAEISKKHANFILNLGNAKASDVLKLIKIVKKEVKAKFDIGIKEEIKIISP